jgi:hypothetical protein
MKSAVFGLLIGVLLLGAARSRGSAPADAGQKPGQPASVTLTNANPSGYFPIDRETLGVAPPVLNIRVTKVVNPAKTAIQLLVFLYYQPGAGRTKPEKILIGDVGFYPPDHSAGFVLSTSKAFDQLKATHEAPTDVRLLVELKRIHERNPWTSVEATVAPPEWTSKPGN